jgi:hypothetical protein
LIGVFSSLWTMSAAHMLFPCADKSSFNGR